MIEQPAGAARGRNLRDAILKKEQVLHDDDDDVITKQSSRLRKLMMVTQSFQSIFTGTE